MIPTGAAGRHDPGGLARPGCRSPTPGSQPGYQRPEGQVEADDD
jgi:hypothetical protein